jgi:signal transduction histidine kinase/CheY-like chemotaxis protein
MAAQQLIVILPLLIPVFLAVYLLYYLARRRAPVDPMLAIIVASGGLWCGGYALEYSISDYDTKLLLGKFQYFAYVIGPVGWFTLGLKMQDSLHLLGKRGITLLLVVPTITMLLVFTSDFHHLFWTSKQLVEFNGLTMFENTYGPGFWLHIGYSYMLNLVGALLIFTAMFEAGRYYLWQRIALGLALAMPWAANVVYISGFSATGLDPTPFTIVFSGLLMVFGVFRLGIGDVIPVARAKVLAGIKEGFIVLDSHMRVADFNSAASLMFDFSQMRIGDSAESLFSDHPKLLRLLQRQKDDTDLVYKVGDRIQRISSELLDDENRSQLLLIRDLSADSKIQDALRLVVEGTGTAQDAGSDFYGSLTRSLAIALDIRFALIGVLDKNNPDHLQTMAFWDGEGYRDNTDWLLSGTACAQVLQRGTCVFGEAVANSFPDDPLLRELGIEGYLGTPLVGHAGDAVGLLILMDQKPLNNIEMATSLLEISANRASAEVERRANHAQLRQSEQNYRRIVETTLDGVCVTDATGCVEFANERMHQLLGSGNEIYGRSLSGLLGIKDEDASSLECRITNPAGKTFWVHIARTMVHGNQGEVSGVLNLVRDINEEKQLAETNRRIEQHLQHAQKMESLGVLAGGVAHDFNNLLMPIVGYLDLIRQQVPDDAVVSEYVSRIQHAGDKLAELCNQMLTYSGKVRVNQSDVDINVEITDMRELMRASVPRSIGLEFNLLAGIPHVKADQVQVSQVLMNLVINASESMTGKTTGEITISSGEELLSAADLDELRYDDELRPGRYIYVEVEDQGTGLTEEESSRLFEPFYTTKFAGRGLGMAVVYGIVRSHSGAIRVNSEKGRGTRMRVLLPATNTVLVQDSAPSATTGGEEEVLHGTVLVVDDEDYVRALERGMLESLGFNVMEAGDGASAMATFTSCQPEIDICVIDLTMPDMNGTELLERIHALDNSVPVLLVSGYTQDMVTDTMSQSENIRFLQKPFTVDEMKTALQFKVE